MPAKPHGIARVSDNHLHYARLKGYAFHSGAFFVKTKPAPRDIITVLRQPLVAFTPATQLPSRVHILFVTLTRDFS